MLTSLFRYVRDFGPRFILALSERNFACPHLIVAFPGALRVLLEVTPIQVLSYQTLETEDHSERDMLYSFNFGDLQYTNITDYTG